MKYIQLRVLHLLHCAVIGGQSGGDLHLKDCVLAEVHKLFHSLSLALADAGVEEGVLGLTDLWLLPLLDVSFIYLEVDTLNLEIRKTVSLLHPEICSPYLQF